MGERWIPWLLVGLTIAAFGSVVTHDFSPIDDVVTISQNPKLNPPNFTREGVLWYWSHPDMGLYVPVTYTVWGLLAKGTWVSTPDEHGLFLDARVFHAASLLVHLISVLAAYELLKRSLGRAWPAAAGAMLFGLHPIQVEAVAWTSGLKDVMFGAFSLVALYLYVRAAERAGGTPWWLGGTALAKEEPPHPNPLPLEYQGERGRRDMDGLRFYLFGLLSLLVAMLCKPTAMVTPAIAVVLDYFILKRSAREVVRFAAPWFLAVVPLAVVAKMVQSGAGIATPPIWERPVVAAGSLAFYLGKLLWPTGLTFDHGWEPVGMLQKRWFWLCALGPAVLGAWLIWNRGRRPWLLAAALVSVIALLPVLGFVPFLFQYYSTVAEHYVYLAMLGPAMALAWGLSAVPSGWWRRAAVACGAGAVILSALTVMQLRHWTNEEATLRRMLAVRPRSLLGHNGLGKFYQNRRDWPAAEREFKAAIAIDPKFLPPRENLVNIYSYLGRADEAIEQIRALMAIHSKLPGEYQQDYSGAFFEVGQLVLSQGRYSEAARYLREAVRLHPENGEARRLLAKAEGLRDGGTKGLRD